MAEFEKSSEHVRGRNVMVTSWLDPDSGSWRASAPGVMLASNRTGRSGHSTRRDAITDVVRQVDEHFKKTTQRYEQP